MLTNEDGTRRTSPHIRKLIRFIKKYVGDPRTGAEIGVYRGDAVTAIHRVWPSCHMTLVDPWREWEDGESFRATRMGKHTEEEWIDVYYEAMEQIKESGGPVLVYRMMSEDAAKLVPDGSLDFVFIDADHSYESVKRDLELWYPKVTKLICGHDYSVLNKAVDRRRRIWGVKKAVDEFFGEPNVIKSRFMMWGFDKRKTMLKMNGAFSKRYQARRARKGINQKLMNSILAVLPDAVSVVDVGAAIGLYVRELKKYGFKVHGLDGTPSIDKISGGCVQTLDLSSPLSGIDCLALDAAWGLFFEVGEHIPREYEQIVIDNVSVLATDGLIVTWAGLNQRGKGHVNCRSPVYVAAEFARRGWTIDEPATLRGGSVLDANTRSRFMVLRKTKS